MKAYLIDVATRTIREIEYSGDYTEIYKLCGFDCFDCVRLDRNGDVVYVDDEGLTKGPVYQFFGIRGYGQPIAGNGLILGTDDEGETIAPKNTLAYYRARLCWIERLTNTAWSIAPASRRSRGATVSIDTVADILAQPLRLNPNAN